MFIFNIFLIEKMNELDFPDKKHYLNLCCRCFFYDGKYLTYKPIRERIHRQLKDCNNEEHRKILNNLLRECESCDYSSPKFAISLKKILTQS